MKTALILILTFTSMIALAQEKGKSEDSKLSIEQIATLRTKKMTLALDLSTAQQSKVKSLYKEQAKLHEVKRKEHKTHESLKDGKKPTSEQRYAMQIERLDQQITHKDTMKKILSAEQYKRWEKMPKRNGKHRKQKREEKRRQ